MGASDVVPGVSGGTMALILGIYEELIRSIKAFDLTILKMVLKGRFVQAINAVPFGFLLPLGFGILTAIFTLAKGISWLLENHPVAVWSFFLGWFLRLPLWLPVVSKNGIRHSQPVVSFQRWVPISLWVLSPLIPLKHSHSSFSAVRSQFAL